MKGKMIKRYAMAFLAAAALGALLIFAPDIGNAALGTTLYSLEEMALIIPPIFILLGLLDVWVPRETMVRFMGEGSGIKGMVLAVLLGSAAAGPLYAAFPVAAVFLKKGAKFSNVLLFMGAWSTTKVPMVLFELGSMGAVFTFTRLGLSVAGISIIAFAAQKLIGPREIERIYENANNL
ncbi:MAG: permease [Eubacteriales bacterium]|nr:permease [Eubacteriales bacterium]